MNRVLVSLSSQNLFWPESVVCTDLFHWNFELIEISSGVLKLSHENILEDLIVIKGLREMELTIGNSLKNTFFLPS